MASNGDPVPSFLWQIAVTVVGGLVTLITAIVGFVTIRLHNKVDALGDKVETQRLEDARNLVTRDEFRQYMDRLTTERSAMHGENKGLITAQGTETRDTLRAISDKLDLYGALAVRVDRNERDYQDLERRVREQSAQRGG